MLRALFRFIGFWILAAALVAGVVDGVKSIAASGLVLTPLLEAWTFWAPEGPAGLERLIAVETGQPWLWSLVQTWLLGAPVALVLALLGFLFVAVGRKPRRNPYAREYAA